MIKSLFKSKQSKTIPDKTIEYVIKILREKNHEDIKAVIPDFTYPKRVKRTSTGEAYIPDVTAMKDGQYRLFSIETRDSIQDKETEDRWRLFADYASQNKARFYIVFPVGMVGTVKSKLKELNIEAGLWETSI